MRMDANQFGVFLPLLRMGDKTRVVIETGGELVVCRTGCYPVVLWE